MGRGGGRGVCFGVYSDRKKRKRRRRGVGGKMTKNVSIASRH